MSRSHRTEAEIERIVRPNGTEEIVVRPPPAIFEMSSYRGPEIKLRSLFEALLRHNVHIELSAEARVRLKEGYPDLYRELLKRGIIPK